MESFEPRNSRRRRSCPRRERCVHYLRLSSMTPRTDFFCCNKPLLSRTFLRAPNIMKHTCAVTILAQNAKQGTPLSHSKQVTCDKVLGQNSCPPEGLQPESALDCVARLGKVLDIPCDERLSSTDSGCNARVFHYVRHSKSSVTPLVATCAAPTMHNMTRSPI